MNNYEADTLVLILPMPPSVNSTYGYTCQGGRVIKYIREPGKKFFQEVKEYVEQNNFNIQANIRLKVEVIVNFSTNHRNDLDNRMKALLDSLTKAEVWEDDALIDDLHVVRGIVGKPGGVIVKIESYKA